MRVWMQGVGSAFTDLWRYGTLRLLPRVSHQLLFFSVHGPCIQYSYSNVSDSFARARFILQRTRLLIFFFWFHLLFRVISDMLCTCISQAVAHTQSHIFHFIVILLHVYHSSTPSRKVLVTMDPRSRSRWHCNKTKESKWAGYDPKTLPTLFFTTPVSICPPKPPIDQLEETMF